MGVHVRILPELTLMLAEFSGHVSDAEFRVKYDAAYADPVYRPGFFELALIRNDAVLDFPVDCLRYVANLAVEFHKGHETKTAIVVSNPVQVSIPKLYSAVTDIIAGVEHARVFDDPTTAIAWLGLPLEQLSEKFPPGYLKLSYAALETEENA